jgi:hypothetical protein
MALAPTAAATAAQVIWFDGDVIDGANKYSAVRPSLIGGRTAIIDSAYHAPRVRTLTSSNTVLYSRTGPYEGGAVDLSHARRNNVKSSCNYLPYGGAPSSHARLVCKYTY